MDEKEVETKDIELKEELDINKDVELEEEKEDNSVIK